jgi:hypothetical protein
VCIDHIRIDYALILNLLLYLLILDLLFLTIFLLHLHLLILHHSIILRGLILIVVLVDSNDLVKTTLILHIEVSECLQEITNVDEVILLDLLSNQCLCLGSLLGLGVIAFDNGQDFISYSLKGLWGLILDKLINLSQILLVNQLIFLSLWSIVEGVVELLLKDVATLQLPRILFWLGSFRWFFWLITGRILPHGCLIDLTHQALHFLKILVTHNYKRIFII